ncbi:hypothetical protein MBLNU457_g1039t1 [Dothideomycetes sp. NU457]
MGLPQQTPDEPAQSQPSTQPPSTLPATDPMQAPSQTPSSSTGISASTLPPAAIALASKLFDHARTGNPELTTYVSAGIPPNLTNHKGDTLLMLAAYHGHTDTVQSDCWGGV